MSEPTLSVAPPPARIAVRAVALVMHGGRETSTAPVNARQLSVVRMIPFARALRRKGGADGLAVARLRFAVRGWNGEARSPVADATWAIEQLTERFPGVPIVLIGHSMGGRTALYLAGHRSVVAVVALAPWIEEGDPIGQLAGRRLLVVHGARDRVTSPKRSARLADRAKTLGATVTYVSVPHENHAMTRRPLLWHRRVANYVTGLLREPDLRQNEGIRRGEDSA
ncbi:MAG TPA: alpha/beta fold hydrolase [Jatrophihabitantaceae bacterium]|nr:alpha/beta fold hydrolase [Jatrophihabitantaceae bacterium]